MPVRLDELLKAAGEPTRLRILNLLSRGSVCVCDIQSVLGIPQPTISRHLGVLRHAGLVRDDRQGTRMIYSLTNTETSFMAALYSLLDEYSAHEKALRTDLDLLRRANER
jgi:ArsR family transcriptional regulator, arsenate/arsenite/antimonite-responsive transcriptional repressor